MAVFQRKLATLPVVTYQAGETVLSAASTTGQLLILKEGAVSVIKEGLEIATVTEAGAVFGELSVLLDRPHTTPLGRRTKVAKFVEGLTQSRVHQNPAAYNTEIPVRDAFVNLRTLPMS